MVPCLQPAEAVEQFQLIINDHSVPEIGSMGKAGKKLIEGWAGRSMLYIYLLYPDDSLFPVNTCVVDVFPVAALRNYLFIIVFQKADADVGFYVVFVEKIRD